MHLERLVIIATCNIEGEWRNGTTSERVTLTFDSDKLKITGSRIRGLSNGRYPIRTLRSFIYISELSVGIAVQKGTLRIVGGENDTRLTLAR